MSLREFLNENTTRSSDEATHYGMEPTTGMWKIEPEAMSTFLPHYHAAVFENGEQWAIVEKAKPPVSIVKIDIDLKYTAPDLLGAQDVIGWTQISGWAQPQGAGSWVQTGSTVPSWGSSGCEGVAPTSTIGAGRWRKAARQATNTENLRITAKSASICSPCSQKLLAPPPQPQDSSRIAAGSRISSSSRRRPLASLAGVAPAQLGNVHRQVISARELVADRVSRRVTGSHKRCAPHAYVVKSRPDWALRLSVCLRELQIELWHQRPALPISPPSAPWREPLTHSTLCRPGTGRRVARLPAL